MCSSELHVDEHGKGLIPMYRLDATVKEVFLLEYIHR